MGGMNATYPPAFVLGMPSSTKLFEQILLRPPSAVNCEAPMYDHGRTMLLFWSCATTPGDSTASSVGTCESVGISVISRDEMTVPDVAEVVSIRAASAVTSTDCVIAPTSSTTSSC